MLCSAEGLAPLHCYPLLYFLRDFLGGSEVGSCSLQRLLVVIDEAVGIVDHLRQLVRVAFVYQDVLGELGVKAEIAGGKKIL